MHAKAISMLSPAGMAYAVPGSHDPRDQHESGDRCPGRSNFGRCARELIACEQFAGFVSRSPRWESRSRFPMLSTYMELFGSDEVVS